MDPFKVLGMAPIPIKHPSDLEGVRRRAKRMWKRYAGERNKFEAQKVMEAYKMIEQSLKKLGEGAYKVLGRSRKEREMDRHFNRQTKEIKKNKDLRRTLRRAQRGEKRIHLPGDKERIPRHRRRRRRRVEPKKVDVDVIQGLTRLAAVLGRKGPFPRGIKLLHRWMKDYMNMDNREYVFKVLQDVCALEFLLDDADARQDVVLVYEYALAYFSAWFESGDSSRMLARQWQVSTVLACRCYTDDAFTLASTISKLGEAFSQLERHYQEEAQAQAMAKAEPNTKAELQAKAEPRHGGSPPELAKPVDIPPAASPAEASPPSPSSFSAAAESSDDEAGSDDGASEAGSARTRAKDEPQEAGGLAKEELIDLDSEAEDDVKDEVASNSGSDGGESDGSVEESNIFPCPSVAQSMDRLRAHFVDRCLAALFQNRTPLWAKPKIDPFFQDIFYRRAVLTPEQQTKLEAWQSRIKTLQRAADRIVGEANNPLEAHRPVVDSREERVVFDADSNTWAAKQTFDSRDRCGARHVIR